MRRALQSLSDFVTVAVCSMVLITQVARDSLRARQILVQIGGAFYKPACAPNSNSFSVPSEQSLRLKSQLISVSVTAVVADGSQ